MVLVVTYYLCKRYNRDAIRSLFKVGGYGDMGLREVKVKLQTKPNNESMVFSPYPSTHAYSEHDKINK